MDVAAPPKGPALGGPAESSGPIPLAVQPAPFAPTAPVASNPIPSTPIAPAPQIKRPLPRGSVTTHRKPVALITVTVFVMLVLSALVVTVYVTTKTA